jgi:hypothetical protein
VVESKIFNAGVQSAKLKFPKVGCERCSHEIWILSDAFDAVREHGPPLDRIRGNDDSAERFATTAAFQRLFIAGNGIIELSLISPRSITSSTFLRLCSQYQQFSYTHSPRCLELCLGLLCLFQWWVERRMPWDLAVEKFRG